jgi:hypothetical protein
MKGKENATDMRRSIRVYAGLKKPGKTSIRRIRRSLACSVACLGIAGIARAEDTPVHNDYGSLGIIEMPSARMAPDGAISVGASYMRHIQHYSFSFQALPWLEADFRYSGLSHYSLDFPVYYDRSLAFKARLWDETDIFPAVALGINDVVGTGVYSGEYLVASKSLGDFDASLGIGWGRLGSTALFRNPLATLVKSFGKVRPVVSTAGGTNFNVFFHGPNASLFGGVIWHTPLDGLSVLAEYSSDNYTLEHTIGAHAFTPRNQFNVGVSYQATSNASVGLDWLYGTSFGGNISFQLDPTTNAYPQHIGDAPLPPLHVRTQEEQRQALNQLLERRNPQLVGTTKLAAAQRSTLVDALWSQSPAPRDIAISGRTLMVRTAAGSPETICADLSQLVARNGVDIDTVTIEAGSSGRRAYCAVARPNALVHAVLHDDNQGAWMLSALAVAPVITIDASLPPGQERKTALSAIRTDAEKQKITILALSLTDSEVIVYYSNTRYAHESEAVDRLIRILLADAPNNIEKFRLLPTLGSVPQNEFDILRAPAERSIAQTGDYQILGEGNALTQAPMQNPVLAEGERGAFPRFSWSVFPQFRQEFFDPDNPFAVQILAGVQGSVELMPQLSLTGEAEASIYDNFNTARAPDSALPHVRTDFLKFFTQGKNGIGALEANYLFRLAPDVYAVARAGYLESMYAGFGGEVLWRPENQRWAIDADLFDIRERNFDRLFGLQNYHVVTGHVSVFYESPWYGFIFGAHVGQYLAGDRGFTMDITRRFSTGVEVGAFFTKTNVSSAQFGEGSFDKGFIINIPLGWTLPLSTQNGLDMVIRPVQRDGGQRLDGDDSLYDYTRRSSLAEVLRDTSASPP